MGAIEHEQIIEYFQQRTYKDNTQLLTEPGTEFRGVIKTPKGERAVLQTSHGFQIVCHMNPLLDLTEGEVGLVDLHTTLDTLVTTIDSMLVPDDSDSVSNVLSYIYKAIERETGRTFMGADMGIHGSVISHVEDRCKKVLKMKEQGRKLSLEPSNDLYINLIECAKSLLAHYFDETETWLDFNSTDLVPSDLTKAIGYEIKHDYEALERSRLNGTQYYPNQLLGYYKRLLREDRLVFLNPEQAKALNIPAGEFILSNKIRVFVLS